MEITLAQLSEDFGLERIDDESFPEWRENLPELTADEEQFLGEVQRDYLHLSRCPLLEPLVKMVVLSPLLRLAGFYRPPFYLAAEKEVRISSEDEGAIVQGRIDLLVFHPEFWVTVVEAKRAAYSLEGGIPQVLACMHGDPHPNPAFGFLTNGNTFQFLKLIQQNKPRYARSYTLSLDRQDDLYTVLRA
ncbi:MAG: restriction endonuclease subunit R [Cyanophyceae cyanobacterium]